MPGVQIRDNLQSTYSDVYTPEVMDALSALARFNEYQKAVMAKRIERRAARLSTKRSSSKVCEKTCGAVLSIHRAATSTKQTSRSAAAILTSRIGSPRCSTRSRN